MKDGNLAQQFSYALLPFPEGAWQRELQPLIEEIGKGNSQKVFGRLKKKMWKSGDPHSHLNGSTIGKVHPTNEVIDLLNKLEKNPRSSVTRLNLIRTISKSRKEYSIHTYRDLLLQALIPLYLGDYSVYTLRIAGESYRTYLEKLCAFQKKALHSTRFPEQDEYDLSQISTEKNPNPQSKQEIATAVVLKIAETLLEISKPFKDRTKTILRQPLTLHEITKFEQELKKSKHVEKSTFTFDVMATDQSQSRFDALAKGDDPYAYYTMMKAGIMRKIVNVINLTKTIPLFHPVGLKLAEKLQAIAPDIGISYAMEGRIYMEALKSYQLRIKSGDRQCQSEFIPTFNKGFAAYQKAMSTIPKRTVIDSDVPILVELATMSAFADKNQRLLELDQEAIYEILKLGNQAIDLAVPLSPKHAFLQRNLYKARSKVAMSG
ncbi:MAG: hypothetical protein HQM13_04140 [SAR324 cluster bacterium]|nr:hypothetical protein [SAR324 cluster bacterium]